jgi:rfaE bifunctional protein nucleotidyltransferase chain/domain
MPDQVLSKIFTLPELLALTESWRAKKESIVFTNGVFDIIHRGHIDYLQKASHLASRMVLAVNSDASVKRLNKGDDRPIIKEDDRAYLLAAFSFIDAVIIFNDDTPLQLIESLIPSVLVKGGDYSPDAIKGDVKYIVGSDLVKKQGGKVEVIPFLPGYSTSTILSKIRNLNNG